MLNSIQDKASTLGLILTGPTAVGKTQLSLDLAFEFSPWIELINIDTIAFYKELPICSAAPTVKELESTHSNYHFFGTKNLDEWINVNASNYRKECTRIIKNIIQVGRIPLLVGGSGFYLKALMHGMFESPTINPELKKKSDELYSKDGIGPFWQELKEVDPILANKYHQNDHYRIRRAVEHFWAYKIPFSVAKERFGQSGQGLEYADKFIHFHYNLNVDELNPRIELRSAQMINSGAVEEIQDILLQGYDPQIKPLQSVGPTQIIQYLESQNTDIQSCINSIALATKQLAKAQRTWFKGQHQKIRFYESEKSYPLLKEDMRKYIKEFINGRRI